MIRLALTGILCSSVLLISSCHPGEEAGASGAQASPGFTAIPSFPTSASFSYAGPVLDLPKRDPLSAALHETEEDWAVAAASVAWARDQGLQLLPVGEVAAILGSTFVGSPYEPGTLELPGPEGLVVNLSVFDCVTFVEHMLVLARLVVDPEIRIASDSGEADVMAFRARYRRELATLRYRDAEVDGYASRLHYFTEWLDRGIERGDLTEVTDELGGIPDPRPIHFMTSHPEAYRQLREEPDLLPFFQAKEEALSRRVRLFIPEDEIAGVEMGIRNGDIIAAVSTVDGLDIAHTGLALWHDGRLHLLHAPLVGDTVEISPLPLAERMKGIRGQKGIRVARPVAP